MSSPTTTSSSDSSLPASEAEIAELRKEIDRLDAEILAAVKRRSECVADHRPYPYGVRWPTAGAQPGNEGLERFSELGQEGHTLAMLLLRLGRGRLGH